jgi:hypothetical protein
MLFMSFASRFKELCEVHQTTPYQVSLECGFPQSVMSLIATGRRVPRTEHLQKIASSTLITTTEHELLSWLIEEQFPAEAIRLAAKLLGE